MTNIGPFELKDLIIAAVLLLVVGVAMFLLRGALYFGIVLPIWMLVIIIMAIVVIIFLLALTIIRYLRYGKEGFMFATARRTGQAVYIDAELGSDVIDFALVEKASPKDVVLTDEDSGIKVDPSMLSANARPMRASGGLDIYMYSYYNFMPQTVRNHAAFAAINNYFERECKELCFLSIKEFVELISDPEHYLERNSLIKLNKYFEVKVLGCNADGNKKYSYTRRYDDWIEEYTDEDGNIVPRHIGTVEQELTLSTMRDLITKARQDVSVMPIMGGLLAGTEAFKYNSVAYSSQHLGHVLMLYYTKMLDEMKGKIEILTYAIAGLLILMGGAVAIYVISMAFGGK